MFSQIPSHKIGDIVDLLDNNILNLAYARKVIALLFDEKNKFPAQVSMFKQKTTYNHNYYDKCIRYFQIVVENNWEQISDLKEIEELCIKVMLEYPKAVKDYRRGKIQAIKFLLGHLAKKTNNRANLALASKKLEELLKT